MFNKFYSYITGLINNRFVYQDTAPDKPKPTLEDLDTEAPEEGGLSDSPLGIVDLEATKSAGQRLADHKREHVAAAAQEWAQGDYMESFRSHDPSAKDEEPSGDIDLSGEEIPENEIARLNEERFAKASENQREKGRNDAAKDAEKFINSVYHAETDTDADHYYAEINEKTQQIENEIVALQNARAGIKTKGTPQSIVNLVESERAYQESPAYHRELGSLTWQQKIELREIYQAEYLKGLDPKGIKVAVMAKKAEGEQVGKEVDTELARYGIGEKKASETKITSAEKLVAAAKTAEGAGGELAYIKDHLLDADEGELKNWIAYISRVSDVIANAEKGSSIDTVVTQVLKKIVEKKHYFTAREKATQENIRWLGAVAKMAGVKPGEGSQKEVAQKMFDNIMAYKIPSYKKDTLRDQFELRFS